MDMEKVMGVINSLNGKKVATLVTVKEGLEDKFKKSISTTDIDPTLITKKTVSEVLVGKEVKYRELKESVDGLKKGELETTGKLAWGVWKVGYEGTLIEHKGNVYLRYYIVKDGSAKTTTEYTYNGKTFDIDSVKSHLKKVSSKDDDSNLITCLVNIKEIDDIKIIGDFT